MPTSPVRTSTRLDGSFVPSSYEELFNHYYDYVVRYVISTGIDPQSAEDVAMTVLAKFIEKDALSDFDPEHTTNFDGVVRKSMFLTFLTGFIYWYVRHDKDKIQLQRVREGISLDTPLHSDSQFPSEYTYMDLLAEPVIQNHDYLEEFELVSQIRAAVSTMRPRNAQDLCDMPVFLEAVLEQAYTLGRINIAALAEQFGVTGTSIQNWLKRLRARVSLVISE